MGRVITFSGVHGAGKSTSISLCAPFFNAKIGKERPKNPFLTPYEAMLFFVASFTWRDTDSLQHENDIFLDRWSLVDIPIYTDALTALNRITEKQALIINEAIKNGSAFQIKPNISFLIDVEPDIILDRIEKFRTPSKHHIFERDIEFITTLRDMFLLKFNSNKLYNCSSYIVEANNRSQESIKEEIIDVINSKLINQ